MSEGIARLERQIMEMKQELARLRREATPEEVEDYVLLGPGGEEVRLSQLFGESDDLILVHNMGRSCPYCTLWADGFNGVLAHLEDRAAFVVVSPDDPDTQSELSESRGWKFRMVSGKESPFTEDMGFRDAEGGWWPGVSTFRKWENGKIVRIAHAGFGPGDDFCSVWHFFDLLAGGSGGWEAKFSY
jgi:predicted dithiol-disulfide oxidoreductase (DUF899 family)